MTKIKNYENMPITAGELAHRIISYLQVRTYDVAYSFAEIKKNVVSDSCKKGKQT